MRRDCQCVTVINIRSWPISQHISVWSEISWMDKRTLKGVKKRLEDSPVKRAGKVGSVVLWGYGLDSKVEIVPRDEGG